MVRKTAIKRITKIVLLTALLCGLGYQTYMAYMWKKSLTALAGYTEQVQKYALETTDEYNACVRANSELIDKFERSF